MQSALPSSREAPRSIGSPAPAGGSREGPATVETDPRDLRHHPDLEAVLPMLTFAQRRALAEGDAAALLAPLRRLARLGLFSGAFSPLVLGLVGSRFAWQGSNVLTSALGVLSLLGAFLLAGSTGASWESLRRAIRTLEARVEAQERSSGPGARSLAVTGQDFLFAPPTWGELRGLDEGAFGPVLRRLRRRRLVVRWVGSALGGALVALMAVLAWTTFAAEDVDRAPALTVFSQLALLGGALGVASVRYARSLTGRIRALEELDPTRSARP